MTASPDRGADDHRYWADSASIPHTYLLESVGIRRGMWIVSWLRDLLGVDLEELTSAAARVPVGLGGAMTVLDWLAPTDHPHRRGAIPGFDGTQGHGHLYRSLVEGIALTMRRHTVAMESSLVAAMIPPGRPFRPRPDAATE
ncbi:FGGY-family carbohydrate kinase [Nakamurella deserti]|uniref:FGGY-family carbohydrate kinase n=1 Tax=Nakamurella deserti TaxID=2164074 RepID=UPI000DBE51B0|nr:FGGY-family carbohydrate kinase [Nakamurella deserti]